MADGGDTIVALATPPGVGGLGVVRLSGPRALAIAERIAGGPVPARRAAYRILRDPDGTVIDDGIVLGFEGPGSYTGEDVVELQGHGSPLVLQHLIDTALALGARLARPGEFTERAFLNGRMDLAQAEAVADLIHAQTAAAARLARNSLDGALAREIEPVAAAIRHLRVHIEADIDFGETDLESTAAPAVAAGALALARDIEALQARLRPARVYTTGLRLALVGAPNVGKSSLMNRLAEAEVAIVTDRPGTTRDLLRAGIAIDGIPVELIDTAGLHDSEDPIERIGMARAREAAAGADLILEIRDLTRPTVRADVPQAPHIPRIRVWNKSDLAEVAVASPQARVPVSTPWPTAVDTDSQSADVTGNAGFGSPVPGSESPGSESPGTEDSGPEAENPVPEVMVSASTGAGLDALRAAVRAQAGLAETDTQRFSVRARHLEGLAGAAAALRRIHSEQPADLMGEDLRLAEQALDALLGRGDHEALLGAIFAGFCIGK